MPTCGRGSANSQKQRPWHCGLGAGRREAPRAQLSPAAGWRLSEEQAGVTVVTLYSLCSASPREPCRLAAGTARIRGRGDGMYKARKRGEDWVNNTPVPKAFCSLIPTWVEFQRAVFNEWHWYHPAGRIWTLEYSWIPSCLIFRMR